MEVNIDALVNSIRVLCEQNHHYTDHIRTDALHAIYHLADLCVEDLGEQPPQSPLNKTWNELRLLRDASEEGLVGGDLPEAFHKCLYALGKIVVTPEEP